MTLLDERELTAEERAAIADEPRPGVWIEEHVILAAEQNDGKPIAQQVGDGRALDQAQTDSAIAAAHEGRRQVVRHRPTRRHPQRSARALARVPCVGRAGSNLVCPRNKMIAPSALLSCVTIPMSPRLAFGVSRRTS